MSCLFEPIHGRFPTHSICDPYPDCVGCNYSDKEKPKTFCDTCGHQYSDICGGCETLNGVPVMYSQKPPAIRPMQLDGKNIIAGKLKDDAFEIVRLDNDYSDNPV